MGTPLYERPFQIYENSFFILKILSYQRSAVPSCIVDAEGLESLLMVLIPGQPYAYRRNTERLTSAASLLSVK